MIVTSDFFDHWKTKALVSLSGRPEAPLWLMRLWAHCYNSKTTRFRLPDIALKAICNVPSEITAEQWLGWLLECRFITGKSGDWTVYGFAEVHSKLTSAWVNGRLAHRKPKANRTTTEPQPNANPTHTETPLGTPVGRKVGRKDQVGRKEEVGREDGSTETPAAPTPEPSKCRPQNLSEVKAYLADLGSGIHPEQAAKFFDHFEANGWRTRSGPVRDWRAAFRNWLRRADEFGQGGATSAGKKPSEEHAPAGVGSAGKWVDPKDYLV